MRKFRLRVWAAALVVALLPWLANAAGLGKLTILSSLGQPLNAEIDIVSVQKDEAAALAARLASPEAYQQSNLQYPPGLAALRFSVEKRANGQPYIKVTSTRPVNEPVVDLLVELAWPSGRISRAYTALIDPPGYGESAAPTQSAAAPEPRPIAPPVMREAPAPVEPRAASPRVQASAGAMAQYGPIKRGETLAKVAGSVKPEGVTLDQMLVGLYRNNPDAFVNNMNRMKTGRILKIPPKEELAALAPAEATQEVRVQASDWNSYRRRLAESAAAVAEERGRASGRITAQAEDRSAPQADRDVVRLSKGEPAAGPVTQGKGRSAGDRLRALEEEAIAREKALSEANQRIAELEKTIKDQQRLLALKGGAAPAPQEAATPAQVAPAPQAPAAAKPEAAKPAMVPPPKEEAVKTPAPAAGSEPAPKPKPKPKVVEAPPPTPNFVDTLVGDPLYVGGGAAVIILAGAGYWLSRRRREAPLAAEPPKVSPTFRSPAPAATAAAAAAAAVAVATTTDEKHAPVVAATEHAIDEVDALAEAEVYIAYGRDAQAEEILKDALAVAPARQEVLIKLLEIYAARKDRRALGEYAEKLRSLTSGTGENWAKAAAMGATIDPENPLYKSAAGAAPTATEGAVPLDLDLGGLATAKPEETAVPEVRAGETAPALASAAAQAAPAPGEPTAPLVPEFTLEIPSAETPMPAPSAEPAAPAPAPAATAPSNAIDFSIELPPVEEIKPQEPAPAKPAPVSADAGLDFKLDFSDINLQLDEKAPSPAPAAETKDAHWHDVQQKFDLAKAYEEMGDKDGAREVLQEVVTEGDTEQQTQAKKLLEALV